MDGVIDQLMWKSQQHYRIGVQVLVDRALEQIGAQLDPQVTLVGIANDSATRKPVCIEPATSQLRPEQLVGIGERIGHFYEQERQQQISYSDTEGNTCRLRGRARAHAITEACEASAAFEGMRCLVSSGCSVKGFNVHVVIAVDQNAFDALPTLLGEEVNHFPAPSSFTGQVIRLILNEADAALAVREPSSDALRRSAEGIVREAAEQFCAGCLYRTYNFDSSSALEAFNAITFRSYESSDARGRFLLAVPDHTSIEVATRLVSPVPLHAERAVRKLLRTSDHRFALLVHAGGIYGLGRLASGHEPPDVFEVSVTAHATWELRRGGDTMLRVAYGRATLANPMFDARSVADTLDRVFGSEVQADLLLSLISTATTAGHGTTLVISSAAAKEAARLGGSATLLVPDVLTPELLSHYAEMDGAVLIDPNGICHGVVILDGQARGRGDPARGARYNSALRYEASTSAPTVIAVVSEDGGVDVVPKPRPRVRRQTVSDAIIRLEESVGVDRSSAFFDALTAVSSLSFYLSTEQCQKVNYLTTAERERCRVPDSIATTWPTLAPNPDMNDSYFVT